MEQIFSTNRLEYRLNMRKLCTSKAPEINGQVASVKKHFSQFHGYSGG